MSGSAASMWPSRRMTRVQHQGHEQTVSKPNIKCHIHISLVPFSINNLLNVIDSHTGEVDCSWKWNKEMFISIKSDVKTEDKQQPGWMEQS